MTKHTPETAAAHIAKLNQQIVAMENTDRLGHDGIDELRRLRDERDTLRFLIAKDAEHHDNPDLVAVLRRIERKADIMRLDAKARGNTASASDADEIRLLAGIALRTVGTYA